MVRKSVTIRDIARETGLSVASISRVLNDHPHVHPDTRKNVVEVMEALGYTPNAAARSLSTSKSHAIGVVLPDLHGEFFSELIRGMDRAANERGFLLLLSTMHADSKLAAQAISTMRGRVDGVIVMAPQLQIADLNKALPMGLSAVLINSPDDSEHHNFRIDNRGGVMLMVRHLLANGRKNIVHLSGVLDNLDAAERASAYRDAMKTLAPELPIKILEGDFSDESGERLMQQLLSDGTECDAIFAANDMMALGALQALRTVGVKVPSQIAVAGFDDIPIARYLGLTTMRVDIAGLGERAVTRLLDDLENKTGENTIEKMTPALVARATTAS